MTEDAIDYRELLRKYMAHVLESEGTTFTVHSPEWDEADDFSEAERAAVESIARAVYGVD